MIISVDELLALPEFSGQSEQILTDKLTALEDLIRAYTNNNFQNRAIRFEGASVFDRVYGSSPYLKVGDTVQITQSQVNDGLYIVEEITDEYTRLDSEIFAVSKNLVTKVEYPSVIKKGIIDLMKWEFTNRDKVGIQQETISRHSVTYFNMDGNNSVIGYPKSLLGFLKPYMKARF